MVRSKRFYEAVFIIALCVMICIWGADVFLKGPGSTQIDLFFSRTGDFLADAVNVIGYSSQRDPYNNTMYTGLGEKAYPPLVYVVMYAFSRLMDMTPYTEAGFFLNMYVDHLFLIFHMLFLSLAMILGYGLISSAKSGGKPAKIGTALALLLSGPILFTIERGNVIIWVPFLCLAFILFHDSPNRALREIGLICLAIASGIKMTPAVLGLILVFERRWKEAVRTVVYGIVFFLFPFLLLKGGLSNLPLMLRNLGYLMDSYATADGCTIRNIIDYIGGFFRLSVPPVISKISSCLFCAIMLLYCYSAKTLWERVLALTIIIVCVPNYSGYYCAIYFIPATVLCLNQESHCPADIVFIVGLLLVFSPLRIPQINFHMGIALILAYTLYMAIVCIKGTLFSGRKALQDTQ